jgi:hypothetical protein
VFVCFVCLFCFLPFSLPSLLSLSLTLPFYISSLLLLQARKYGITHSTGTLTITRAMMGRRKKRKTIFPPMIN